MVSLFLSPPFSYVHKQFALNTRRKFSSGQKNGIHKIEIGKGMIRMRVDITYWIRGMRTENSPNFLLDRTWAGIEKRPAIGNVYFHETEPETEMFILGLHFQNKFCNTLHLASLRKHVQRLDVFYLIFP